MGLKTHITKSLLVHYDDRVVGEVLPMGIGWAYKHFSFKMKKPSSSMRTKEELLPHIDSFLKEMYES